LAYLEEAELTRLREALDGMKKNLGILDVIEWALQVTQDPKVSVGKNPIISVSNR